MLVLIRPPVGVLRSALSRARGRHQKSPEAHTVVFPVSIRTLTAEMANYSTNVSIFLKVGGAVHTVEGALGHALFDAFADRRETGEAHPGKTGFSRGRHAFGASAK